MNPLPRPRRSRVLVITPDSLGERMAGPAIRAWEMSKALSTISDVRLTSTVSCSISHPDFEVSLSGDKDLRSRVAWSDIIVFQGHVMHSFPWIADSGKIVVVDIYDPMHLEQLEQVRHLPDEERFALAMSTGEVLNNQIQRADFLMCASEKQRDFWLGQLASLYRVNPLTYDRDASLRSLLSVVPFGIDDKEPVKSYNGIKGAIDGITADDKVILWGGGIYNWFDPLTLIHAVAELAKRRPNVRLFFLGATHPNPNVPAMEMATRAHSLADELDLTGKHVFFNQGWVPYDERASYLLDSDVGVSTHFDHLETSFSFRTRLLDYLWASLPIVATDGDTFAPIIREHGLGQVVPTEDVQALVAALDEELYGPNKSERVKNIQAFAETMRWSKILQPLLDFVLAPRPAADDPSSFEHPLQRRVNDLETRVRGLESSTSWRITAPIRAVGARRARRRLKKLSPPTQESP